LSEVPGLLQHYKGCLADRKLDEAKNTIKKLNFLIASEFNTPGNELNSFAEDLLQSDRCEEAIAVFFVAISLFKEKEYLWGMSECLGGYGRGIHEANSRMINYDITMKEVVKYHVIPIMHDFKNQMLEMTAVNEEDNDGAISWALGCIAWSEGLVYDDETANETYKERGAWNEMHDVETQMRNTWGWKG